MSEKENIIESKEQMIIVYGLKNERFNTFSKVASEYGYRIIEVEDNQTYCVIEDLINEDTNHCIKEDATPVDIEFILFINILNDDLYDFIRDLKEENIYLPNKAILTKTNIKWKLRRLLAENKEEHLVMTMFTNLRRAMKKAQILKDNDKHDDELVDIMDKAQNYLHPREFDFDEMKNIHNELALKVNELGKTNEE